MSPSYEVTVAELKKTWTGRQGQNVPIWEVQLSDESGLKTGEQFGGEKPVVGSTAEYNVEQGQYGLKFTPVNASKGASKPSGGYGGRDPAERAEIRRSVALKAAVELLAIEVGLGMKPETGEPMRDVLSKRVDVLDELLKVNP